MTPINDDSLATFEWLLDAGIKQLFNSKWILRNRSPLQKHTKQQAVPLFDRMEQRLLDGPPIGQQLQQRLKGFFEVCNHFSDIHEFGMAASRMLVRLLRTQRLRSRDYDSVKQTLGQWLSRHPLWPQSPPPTFSVNEIESFIIWEREHCLGRHRLLFPIYFEQPEENLPPGALVAAEVSVVECKPTPEILKDHAFFLAPWSWFAWEYVEPEVANAGRPTFATVTDALREALIKTVEKIKPDGPKGCLLGNQSVVFVIDLQPLSVEKDYAPCIGARAAQARAWSSNSWAFLIGGDSMGLTLAFSAWAATEGLSVRPLIATGKVARNSEIDLVDGEEAKCKAIDRFCEQSELDWWRVFPEDWNTSKYIDRNTKHAPRFPEDLRKAFELDLLTDGFDAYRTELGVQGNGPTTKLKESWKTLQTASEEETPDGKGYLDADRIAAETIRELLLTWLRSPNRESVIPHDLFLLTAPFGADPQIFADWLLKELWFGSNPGSSDDWLPREHRSTNGNKLDLTRVGMLPVIVPVNLEAMFKEDKIPARTLAERLATSIQSQFTISTPTADQMAIALRNRGKLVLLVYSPMSLEWWKMLVPPDSSFDTAQSSQVTPAVWEEIANDLKVLRTSPNNGRYAKQIVVWICSDLHHQYRWFGRPTKSSVANDVPDRRNAPNGSDGADP